MNKRKKCFLCSKQDKLTEKAFTQSIAVSVISILLCIATLCSVTWAWFSENVTASSTLKAGNCDVTVLVIREGTEIARQTDTTGTYTFEADQAYQIRIVSTGSAKSSYCKLVIGDREYYTEQVSTSAPNNTISFTLTFDATTEVEILTRWGTYHTPNDARDFYDGMSYTNAHLSQGA